jgi:hypothetical protein
MAKLVEHEVNLNGTGVMVKTINKYKVPVGAGMSGGFGSDCYPYVVVRVGPSKIWVRRAATGNNRVQWPDQDFPIFLNQPEGAEIELTLGKYGWVNHGQRFSFGARYYLDPSF